MNREEIAQRLMEKRIVALIGDIDEENINRVRGILVELGLESEDPITLIIDTNGGSCEPALWLVDMMSILKPSVTGIVSGKCYSAGVVVLQGCSRRLATLHSLFCVHAVNSTFRYDAYETDFTARLQTNVDHTQEVQRQMWDLLVSRTGRSLEEIQAISEKGDKHDWHFSAATAKDLGFIDDITTEKLF